MSDDLIKREDAIKAINARSNWYQVTCNGKQIAVMLMAKDVNEILEKVPSADRPQGWIPCSERLPSEEKATYLVCTDSERMCSCRWTNTNPIWTNLTTEWHWCIFDIPQYSKVVAWMPLEPWKGADDE